MAREFNRDIMANASIPESAASAMHVIDAAQHLPPHLQLIGITATFKLMIERFGVSPSDAFTITDNIMNNAEGRRAEFNAVRAYLENEL